jgi:hypothetical protein
LGCQTLHVWTKQRDSAIFLVLTHFTTSYLNKHSWYCN